MLAVRLHRSGDIDSLSLEEIEKPEPAEGETVVRVRNAAITRGELEWPEDRLPAIPSYELSGTDELTGEDVFGLTPFDRDGVATEFVSVRTDLLAPKPSSLSHEEAAALTMTGLSAYQALVVHGGMQRGQRVHITGRRGGVGHVAVQLVLARGAVLVDAGDPCDLLFDTAGGEEFERVAPSADKVVTIAEEAPGAHYFVVEPNGEQLLELGDLRPEIDSIYPLDEFRAAFERCESRGKHGKVVMSVAE